MNVLLRTRGKTINKPEGCIAEETIAEETIKFFSEYHKSMETIGIPLGKHETYENDEEKPLSAGKSSKVSAKLFQKAHLIENIVVNLDSSSDNNNSDSYSTSQISTSEEIDYDSPELPTSLLKWQDLWGAKINELLLKEDRERRRALEVDSDVNLLYDVMFFGPYVMTTQMIGDGQQKKQVLQYFMGHQHKDCYMLRSITQNEEYLSWNYFPSTDNESTDMETIDKRNTYKVCIVDSNSTMSKGKYIPVCKKNKPNVYIHVQVTKYVLGLLNVTTWDEIEKKIGAGKSKTCADKAKGKRKVSCGS
ncbi:hypothetical protein Tco_1211499 [Tanacetum coccineum]